jgi:hypothetical protein
VGAPSAGHLGPLEESGVVGQSGTAGADQKSSGSQAEMREESMVSIVTDGRPSNRGHWFESSWTALAHRITPARLSHGHNEILRQRCRKERRNRALVYENGHAQRTVDQPGAEDRIASDYLLPAGTEPSKPAGRQSGQRCRRTMLSVRTGAGPHGRAAIWTPSTRHRFESSRARWEVLADPSPGRPVGPG